MVAMKKIAVITNLQPLIPVSASLQRLRISGFGFQPLEVLRVSWPWSGAWTPDLIKTSAMGSKP